jgi:hypothetical protein
MAATHYDDVEMFWIKHGESNGREGWQKASNAGARPAQEFMGRLDFSGCLIF